VFNTTCTELTWSHRSNHFTLSSSATTSPFLHHLAFYLYITKGINMGKTHGSTSHTRYINPNPKSLQKGGEIPRSPLCLALPSSTSLSKSQNWSNMTKVLQNLVKGVILSISSVDFKIMECCSHVVALARSQNLQSLITLRRTHHLRIYNYEISKLYF
jgi:hypothetical protein